MQSDLLEAQAAVDWAKSNVHAFQERIQTWCNANFAVVIRETPAETPYDLVVIVFPELPIEFSIEAGAYINTIRSSLDILACALAAREPVPVLNPDDIYFPVADSALDFERGNYKGSKFVAQLNGTARKALKECEPYHGGNIALWTMHRLDIIRKHKRLLAAEPLGTKVKINGWTANVIRLDAAQVATHPMRDGEGLVGGWPKGKPHPKFEFSANIVLDEMGLVPDSKKLVSLLDGFANCATAIIRRFDY